MLKKYYSRVATKEDEAKKDGGDGGVGGFPSVENVFLIFVGGVTVDMSNNQRKAGAARSPCRGEGSSLLPRLVRGRHHLQPRGSPKPHPQPGPVPVGH
jgi:hypothetical protein